MAGAGPGGYGVFDGARSIRLYANPKRLPEPQEAAGWPDARLLAGAGSDGDRVPVDKVTVCAGDPGTASGAPETLLKVVYSRAAGRPLPRLCAVAEKETGRRPVYLWRFQVSGQDGKATGCCFRARVARIFEYNDARMVKKTDVTLDALDARPLVWRA